MPRLPRRRHARRLLLPAALVGCGAMLVAPATGCSGGGGVRTSALRANLTPELYTLYQRPGDVLNEIAISNNENLRMLRQDWQRFTLTDRPSRLTREPIPQ